MAEEVGQSSENVDVLLAKDKARIKEEVSQIREFTEIQFVPGKEERVGYFPNLEDLDGNPILARYSYGYNAPNMSAVFFDPSLGEEEGKRIGEENTQNFLTEEGFGLNTIQVLGKFDKDGIEAQIEEVDLDTLQEKRKAIGNVIFTRDPRVTLIIKPADCPTGVLYCKDKEGRDVVAIIHGGADAINAGLTRQGLLALQIELGVDLSTAKLAIFPGVSKENFFISRQWRTASGEIKKRESGIYPINWGDNISPAQTDDPEEKRYVDILSAFEMQAMQAGMKAENVEGFRVDTYADAAKGRAKSRRFSNEHNNENPGGNLLAVRLKPKEKEVMEEEIIVDSNLTLEDALAQRSEMPAPKEVLDRQRLVDVEYYSFDQKLHRGQIVVDKDLVDDIKGAFDLIKRNKFPVQLVIPIGDLRFMGDDVKSIYANNSSGFNYRNIAKTNKLSNHAFGRAVDINPYINPYIRDDYRQPEGVDYDPALPGAITVNSELVKYFKQKGWEWGGDWEDRKDYQHFEKPHIA